MRRNWSSSRFGLHHFGDPDGGEVDLLIEAAYDDLIAVEVKAAKSVHKGDFRGLERVRDRSGPAFKAGVVLHVG